MAEEKQENDIIKNIDPKNQTGLGCHIWKVPTSEYGNHAEIAVDHYMKHLSYLGAWQIFSHGPKSKKLIKQDNPEQIYELAKKIPLIIHSSYLTSQKDISHITDQIYTARQYGAHGVVIHIPKISVAEIIKITEDIINTIKNDDYFSEIVAKHKGKNNMGKFNMPIIPRIIWEAKAIKKCDQSFESPEKWNALATALKENNINPDTVGLNIDTAHIYASGAKINTSEDVIKWLSGLSELCMTYMKSGLLHLNGNEYHQDVRAGDKHAIPGSKEDMIWKDEKDITNSGCSEFIKWAQSNNIPIILELKHDVEDIATLANKFN